MMWNYIRLDFGESYFRSISVIDLVLEKMPVSISLGLWSTLIAYLVSIPLGIRKAVNDGTRFDTWTSGIIIMAYAIPGFLFAIILLVLFAADHIIKSFRFGGYIRITLLNCHCWVKLRITSGISHYPLLPRRYLGLQRLRF